MPTTEDIRRRFFSKFEKETASGCWIWKGAVFARKKYGIFYWGVINGKEKMMTAHRAAWTLFRGEPPFGAILCHKCNNPACVNPDHLYAGTHKTNAEDRDAAGTTSRWGKRYNFKRTDDLLARIKTCVAGGLSIPETRKALGIGWTTIYRCRDQDPELMALMAATKTARYSKAGKKRWEGRT